MYPPPEEDVQRIRDHACLVVLDRRIVDILANGHPYAINAPSAALL